MDLNPYKKDLIPFEEQVKKNGVKFEFPTQ